MMFRSVHADDESGSDWDDTPTSTPTHQHTISETILNNQQVSTASRPHKAHTTHSNKTPTSHSGLSHKTPTRPHPSRKSPHQLTDTSQTTGTHSNIELTEHRPPRTLPPIETAIPTSLASPPPIVSVPLISADINPVYKVNESHDGQLDESSRESVAHDETVRLIHDAKSGVLEFFPVSDETAGLLTSTQDPAPYSYMGGIAERSEQMSKRCTEEVFSCMRIVSDFVITFTLGLLYYILYHVTRKLCCGAAHILTDSITTPLINTCFNGLLWPIFSCLYQLVKALVLVLTPIVGLVGDLLIHVANMLRAFRLVDLHFNSKTHHTPLHV